MELFCAAPNWLVDGGPRLQRHLLILVGWLFVLVEHADRDSVTPLERFLQRQLDIGYVVARLGLEFVIPFAEIFVRIHLVVSYAGAENVHERKTFVSDCTGKEIREMFVIA